MIGTRGYQNVIRVIEGQDLKIISMSGTAIEGDEHSDQSSRPLEAPSINKNETSIERRKRQASLRKSVDIIFCLFLYLAALNSVRNGDALGAFALGQVGCGWYFLFILKGGRLQSKAPSTKKAESDSGAPRPSE